MQKRDVLKNLGLIVALSAAVAIGLNSLLLAIDLPQYSKGYQEASEVLYAPPFWKQLFASGILAPILEEIIFRGGVFRLLRRRLSFLKAMLISSVLFGAYHGNMVQFVYAGICGALLAYVYEKYDTVFAPVVSHMAMNMVAIVMTEFHVFSWILDSVMRSICAAIVSGIIVCLILRCIHKMDVTKVLKTYCKEKTDDI